MDSDAPPSEDELEVSLFGPGVGECIVVHLGGGKWMIVDSCIPPGGSDPAALRYLDKLGVDVANDIKLVVATHWHDDHIGGLSAVVGAATSADFVCSAALQSQEFLALVECADEVKFIEHSSGIAEFNEILSILDSRAGTRFRRGPHHYAANGMRLYRGPFPYDRVEVEALSPSAQTITDQQGQIAREMPMNGEPIRRFMSNDPNDLSVVLLVKSPGYCVLLGGDLEIGADDARGWRAIIKSTTRPNVESNLYKVAHHGSPNANLSEIWTKLLVKEPIAVMAPYARGRNKRPSANDVRRIKRAAKHVYCTVWPFTERPKARARIVDDMLARATRYRSAIKRRPGHIRLRAPINDGGGQVSIEMFGGAKQL